MRIEWSPVALERIGEIFAYIAQHNPVAAQRTIVRIQSTALRLADFPYSGRKGSLAGTRELIIPGTPYLAVYSIRNEFLEIITILHGRQNEPPIPTGAA